MRRFVLIALLLLMGGVTEVEAQSFLKQLGKTVENAAKRKVQQKAEESFSGKQAVLKKAMNLMRLLFQWLEEIQ